MTNLNPYHLKWLCYGGRGQNLPSPCVCYPKDPMRNRVNLQSIRTFFFIIRIWLLLVLVVICSHSHQILHEPCKKCRELELILISSDLKAHYRFFLHIFPSFFRKVVPSRNFRTVTAYNMKTKANFQKLILKSFPTCLNLANKLNCTLQIRYAE